MARARFFPAASGVALLGCFVAGCGDSPTEPQQFSVAGRYAMTIAFICRNADVPHPVQRQEITIQQAGSGLSSSFPRGRFSGVASMDRAVFALEYTYDLGWTSCPCGFSAKSRETSLTPEGLRNIVFDEGTAKDCDFGQAWVTLERL